MKCQYFKKYLTLVKLHVKPPESSPKNYSTQTKPDMIGKYFNADVLEDSGQKILVVRENLTSFTNTMIVQNQTKATLKEALIIVLSRLKLVSHPYLT